MLKRPNTNSYGRLPRENIAWETGYAMALLDIMAECIGDTRELTRASLALEIERVYTEIKPDNLLATSRVLRPTKL